ncbi:MAG: ATP synthase F0 subunit C [Christensenellaceae bacterium]|jgi:F-type H+-transporting ATPase subunit c|nr:ATP synthase F0 subunit C [Christensenellaceae bacterium]
MNSNLPFAVALCLLSCVTASIAMGLATCKAVEAVARQPEASGKITSMLLMGLALTESTAIYGFVTGLIMMLTA